MLFTYPSLTINFIEYVASGTFNRSFPFSTIILSYLYLLTLFICSNFCLFLWNFCFLEVQLNNIVFIINFACNIFFFLLFVYIISNLYIIRRTTIFIILAFKTNNRYALAVNYWKITTLIANMAYNSMVSRCFITLKFNNLIFNIIVCNS